MTAALVIFEFNRIGGWRVVDSIHFPAGAMIPKRSSALHADGMLGLYGNFRRQLRSGTWCKRPHKELAHA